MKSSFSILIFSLMFSLLGACNQPAGNEQGEAQVQTDSNTNVSSDITTQVDSPAVEMGGEQASSTDSIQKASPDDDTHAARQGNAASVFFPLAVGNYWVYARKEGKETDTLRISSSRKIDGHTVYELTNGMLLYEKNDTVYAIQTQRGGHSFSTVQYFPSDIKKDYQIMIGGDAVSSRAVSRMEKPYTVSGKSYANCYRYEQNGEKGKDFEIIARGVGFVERNMGGQHLMLTDYHLTK